MRRISIRLALLATLILMLSYSEGCGGGGGGTNTDTSDGDIDDTEIDIEGDLQDVPETDEAIETQEEDPDDDLDIEEDVDEIEPMPPTCDFSITPDNLDFDVVNRDEQKALSVTLQNGCDESQIGGDITLLSASLLPDTSEAFAITNCETPNTLAVGAGSLDCEVTCSPNRAGEHQGVLRLTGEDANGLPLDHRIDLLCLSGTIALNIDPYPLVFGHVSSNDSPYRRINIGNMGHIPFSVSSITLREDSSVAFSIENSPELPYRIEKGESTFVEIRYQSTSIAEEFAWLEIEFEEEALTKRTIPITARGQAGCLAGAAPIDDVCVPLCVPETRICGDGKKIRKCNLDGDAYYDTAICGEEEFCHRGFCVETLCAADEIVCLDGQATRCAGDGLHFIEEELTACGDENACTMDFCQTGEGCTNEEEIRHCASENPCIDGGCTPSIGCMVEYNTNPCTPESLCYENGFCNRGECVGDPIDCDDENPCTVEECVDETGCVTRYREGVCTDDNLCTVNERCEAGECVGDVLDCDDDNLCTDDTCNPAYGCRFSATLESCDDKNPCTEDDICTTFGCKGEPIIADDGVFCNGVEVCNPEADDASSAIISSNPILCDDGITCTIDSCNESEKKCDYLPDDAECNDNNPCTSDTCDAETGCVFTALADETQCDAQAGVDEICLNGVCSTACDSNADCNDGVGCTYDYCDFTLGFCRHEAKDENCDDGVFCNGQERCNAALGCVSGEPPKVADAFLCTQDSCNEATDAIEHQPRNAYCEDYNECTRDICRKGEGCVNISIEGKSCDDGDPCTHFDFCSSGVCMPGSVVESCDDANPCTDDFCTGGIGCVNIPNNQPCDSPDPCASGGICQEGVCTSKGSCDDGIFCNGVEACSEQGCITVETMDCDDNVACTIDSCSESQAACIHEPDDEACENANPCLVDPICTSEGCFFTTLADGEPCITRFQEAHQCFNGHCAAFCETHEDCDDNIACTNDACNQNTGRCVHTPNNGYCSDNQYCNGEETCDRYLGCLPGQAIDCSDEFDCTVDTCNEETNECSHETNDSRCDDANPCTTDRCNSGSGCVFVNTTMPVDCDDGNLCTENDQCNNGRCLGDPIQCETENSCTTSQCLDWLGCRDIPLPNGTPCDGEGENNICIDAECTTKGCLTDSDCNDNVACTMDSCDITSGQCNYIPNDELCDDGLFCNGEEMCNEVMGCLAGEPMECFDSVGCTMDYCDEERDQCAAFFDDSLCDDEDPCTDDVCLMTGCYNEYNTAGCDDGDPCTTGDACYLGECSGVAIDVDDGNACTEDSCHPIFGILHIDISDECTSDTPCRIARCDPEQGCFTTNRTGLCDDDNPCTSGDMCAGGECIGGLETNCDDGNPCTDDICDSFLGCTHEPMPNGSACLADLNQDLACRNGVCTIPCDEDADCNDAASCSTGVCSTSSGWCQFTFDHESCDDGIFCNGEETCELYFGCVSGEAPDCDDEIDCTIDQCDADADQCTHTVHHALCDDENPCTNDICDAVEGCIDEPLTGQTCNDDDPCTATDACYEGYCTAAPIDCNDDNPCTDDACDTVLGCVNTPITDYTPCNEGEGYCLEGKCASACSFDRDCDDGVVCTVDYCDAALGVCRYLANHNLCDDGNYCNGKETCNAQFGCMAGVAVDCNDDIDCTFDACDNVNRRCEHTTVDFLCDDGNLCTSERCDTQTGCVFSYRDEISCDDNNACTTEDECIQGVCQGAPDNCFVENQYHEECINYACEASLGCVPIPTNGNNNVCEDNNACSRERDSICVGTKCQTLAVCEDFNPCTAGSCEAETTCSYANVPNGTNCFNGDEWEGICENGQCVAGCLEDTDCDDDNPCTDDICDTDNGCKHETLENQTACSSEYGAGKCIYGSCIVNYCSNDTQCNDGKDCTVDSCGPGGVCENLPDHTLCDDGDQCTSDICNSAGGCIHEPLNDLTPCDDGDLCTENDVCVQGLCFASRERICNDYNPCTADACDPSGECTFTPLDDIRCNDGSDCTLNDVCESGQCVGEALDCDDGNECTADFCLADGGCHYQPLTGASCDDGEICSTASACIDGICQPTQFMDCDDENECTKDYCEFGFGCRFVPASGLECSDSNRCTVGDRCVNSQCEAGDVVLDCDDGDDCTHDTCDPLVGCQHQNICP